MALFALPARASDEIPAGPELTSHLEKGHFITDGGFHFSKTAVVFPDRPAAPVTVFNAYFSLSVNYFLFDRFAAGPFASYSILRVGDGNTFTLASGLTANYFFFTYQRLALRAGTGLFWETVLHRTAAEQLNGLRINLNLGLQYFFLPTIAIGPTLNFDLTSGSRFSSGTEFSLGGGATVYL